LRHNVISALIGEGGLGESWWPGKRRATWRLPPNSVFILPAQMPTRQTNFAPTEGMNVEILPEMLGASAERLELRPVFGVEDRLVFQLLMALRDELRAEHPAGRLYAETLGNALAAHVSQKYGTAPPARDRRGGLAPHRLRLVKDYVDTHLGRNFGLPELAALAQMKVDSFIRAFKQSMGVPPHRYVLIRRIDRATTLLRVGGRSIPEIAAVSGFGSQSSFTRAFRRLIGVTPREYRTSL
jgi:AraC family transcriptional regulator